MFFPCFLSCVNDRKTAIFIALKKMHMQFLFIINLKLSHAFLKLELVFGLDLVIELVLDFYCIDLIVFKPNLGVGGNFTPLLVFQ